MIQAINIGLFIGDKEILSEVDCTVQPGRVTVIMGKNGAGKSTLINALAGSDSGPTSGRVTLDGLPLKGYSIKQLAVRRGVLAQSVQLGFDLSVREVVEIGCYASYHDLTGRERSRLIEEHLCLLELTVLADRSYLTLSGGEQKRVLLAKCLLQLAAGKHDGNRYLLLDEPTAALDIEQQYRFVDLATRLARERKLGVVAILHDLNLAARFADELLFLREGRVIASGPAREVLTKEIIRATFDVDCLIQEHPDYGCPILTTLPYGKSIAPAFAAN